MNQPILQHNRKFNLKRHWNSGKDYSFHKTFGAGPAAFAPELLFISEILNQDTEDCTAFSSCAVRASMKDKNYDPYRYWEDECAYDGAPISQDGTSLNTEMNVGVKSGWIPAGQVVHTDKASTYFTISKNNGYDMFDSMRSAIQQSQAPLIAGVIWYADWESPDGIVPDSYKQVMGGHATKIAGWKTINNIPYIVVQNSWGSEVGDGGLFYFSREISNKVFNQGVFVWSDTPNLIIQNLGFLAALLQNLLNLLRLVAGVFKQKNGSSI